MPTPTLARSLLLVVSLLSAPGCVAALPAAAAGLTALSVGVAGFGLFKSYQLASGGAVEVGFGNEVVAPGLAGELRSAGSLAIWVNADESGAAFAQTIDSSGRYARVAGPAAVASTLQAQSLPVTIGATLSGERLSASRTLAAAHDVDQVLTAAVSNQEAASNVLSFRRPSVTYTGRVTLFDRSANVEIWACDFELVASVGGRVPGVGEMSEVFAQAILDRMAELSAGASPVES